MLSGKRKVSRLRQLASAAAGLSLSLSAGAVAITDDFEVAGFARIVGGYLSGTEREVGGYDDSLSLRQQTLFALQPTYTFSDEWSVTGQLLAHTSDDRDSGVEWLYLSYRPDNAWLFRAGKLRMPFFTYSDSIDVGYSYPWITVPAQVYGNYLFSTFNGVSGSYNFAGDNFAVNIEGYYGYFDGDVLIAGSKVDAAGRVDDLRGVVLNLNSNNIGVRLSYHRGYNDTRIGLLEPLADGLAQFDYTDSAQSLDSAGEVTFIQAALSYDTLSSFYKAEWVKTKSEFAAAPFLSGYYFSAGHTMADWTVHATYAASSYANPEVETELQPIVDAGPVDPATDPLGAARYGLAAGYYQLFNALPNGSMDSYTLGVRWDFTINQALKFDVTYFEETSPRSGFFATPSTGFYTEDNSGEKYSATLYQLGWEWVF
ncbi:MAG: hypothetical protein CMI03_08670 [Oceanospirillaceae bacterium]|uniref:hypothetical protein n=2 Tax=unclassified Thalassolituus TaxID=2624967 RepID=UPI000C4DC9B5|nr:hypothetical protein [Thalassolituus sp. UBA1505]MAS24359.1 hypothetical protein [Oceanospirillaceae bacterium]MBL34237.1 hypothetical protein [Oceanospirillaceae bacterium]MBS52811.1 hypothetical protein [Oceanospirillaceae bacterium]